MKRLLSFAFYALITPAITLGAGSVLAEQSTDQDAKQPTSRTGQSDQSKQHANQSDSHPAVESAQRDQDAKKSTSRTGQSDQSKQHANQSDSHPAVESAQRDQDAKKPTSRTGQSDQSKQHASQSDSHPAVESAQLDQDAKKPTSRTGQSDQSKQHASQSDSHPAVESAQRDQSRMKNPGYMDSASANGMQAASDLIGAEVKTSVDENVGTVRDLIVDENGQITAIVVGAGGFLGMGQKDVAIDWDHVTTSGTSDKQELRIDMTREELRSAPKFGM